MVDRRDAARARPVAIGALATHHAGSRNRARRARPSPRRPRRPGTRRAWGRTHTACARARGTPRGRGSPVRRSTTSSVELLLVETLEVVGGNRAGPALGLLGAARLVEQHDLARQLPFLRLEIRLASRASTRTASPRTGHRCARRPGLGQRGEWRDDGAIIRTSTREKLQPSPNSNGSSRAVGEPPLLELRPRPVARRAHRRRAGQPRAELVGQHACGLHHLRAASPRRGCD